MASYIDFYIECEGGPSDSAQEAHDKAQDKYDSALSRITDYFEESEDTILIS